MRVKKLGVAVFTAIFILGVVWLLVSYFGTSKQIYEGTLVDNQVEQTCVKNC